MPSPPPVQAVHKYWTGGNQVGGHPVGAGVDDSAGWGAAAQAVRQRRMQGMAGLMSVPYTNDYSQPVTSPPTPRAPQAPPYQNMVPQQPRGPIMPPSYYLNEGQGPGQAQEPMPARPTPAPYVAPSQYSPPVGYPHPSGRMTDPMVEKYVATAGNRYGTPSGTGGYQDYGIPISSQPTTRDRALGAEALRLARGQDSRMTSNFSGRESGLRQLAQQSLEREQAIKNSFPGPDHISSVQGPGFIPPGMSMAEQTARSLQMRAKAGAANRQQIQMATPEYKANRAAQIARSQAGEERRQTFRDQRRADRRAMAFLQTPASPGSGPAQSYSQGPELAPVATDAPPEDRLSLALQNLDRVGNLSDERAWDLLGRSGLTMGDIEQIANQGPGDDVTSIRRWKRARKMLGMSEPAPAGPSAMNWDHGMAF